MLYFGRKKFPKVENFSHRLKFRGRAGTYRQLCN